MGVYNTIMIPCPKCGKEIECQTKSGDCCLANYTLENAPDQDILDVNRHNPTDCYHEGCDCKNISVEFDWINGKAVNRRVVSA